MDPPPSLGGGLGGPPSDSLLTGEKIVKSERKQLGRSGREHIAYRIIGDNSSGWAEAAILWGGTVDMIVHFSDNNHFVSSALHLPSSIPAKEALSSPPVGDQGWDGVLLSTVLSERDAQGVGGLFQLWQPLIAIFALPPHLPRQTKNRWLASATASDVSPPLDPRYSTTVFTVRHSDLGGVTRARWFVAHYTRVLGGISRSAIMMAHQFQRPLQTALDDTIGCRKGVVLEQTLMEDADEDVLGWVRQKGTYPRPVFSGEGLPLTSEDFQKMIG